MEGFLCVQAALLRSADATSCAALASHSCVAGFVVQRCCVRGRVDTDDRRRGASGGGRGEHIAPGTQHPWLRWPPVVDVGPDRASSAAKGACQAYHCSCVWLARRVLQNPHGETKRYHADVTFEINTLPVFGKLYSVRGVHIGRHKVRVCVDASGFVTGATSCTFADCAVEQNGCGVVWRVRDCRRARQVPVRVLQQLQRAVWGRQRHVDKP